MFYLSLFSIVSSFPDSDTSETFHWIVCWKWYGVHIPAGKVIAIINGVGEGGGDVSITQGQMWTWRRKKEGAFKNCKTVERSRDADKVSEL